MALVDPKVVKESVKGTGILVETIVASEVEVEAKRHDEAKVKAVVTSGTVVAPEGEVEASVSPEAVEENMVGTDAEKEPMVFLEAVLRPLE